MGLALLVGALGGCAGGSERPAPLVSAPQACRVTLAPRGGTEVGSPLEPSTASASAPSATSNLVIDAEVPFARLVRELESRVPRRLAQERDRDIGLAGSLQTTVDRGDFSVGVSAAADALIVKAPIHVEARACTTARGCYASCAPEAIATVTMPLALTEAYALQRPRVSVVLVRGCRISALGGLLQLDLTPTLEAQIAPQARRVEQQLAEQLPDLRREIAPRWDELARPRQLPLRAGCVGLRPSALSQGRSIAGPDSVRLRFALKASPEVRPRCETPAPGDAPAPLPPLLQVASLPAEGDLELRVRTPLAAFADAAVLSLGPAHGAVRSAIARPDPRDRERPIALELTLAGEVCGDVRLGVGPAWKDDGHALGYTGSRLTPAERERLERAGLAPDALSGALEAAARVPLRITPERARDALPALAAALSTADVSVAASAETPRTGAVWPDGEDVLASAWMRARVTARLAP